MRTIPAPVLTWRRYDERHHLMNDTQEDIADASLQPACSELDDKTEDDGQEILRRGSKGVESEKDGRDGSVGQRVHRGGSEGDENHEDDA